MMNPAESQAFAELAAGIVNPPRTGRHMAEMHAWEILLMTSRNNRKHKLWWCGWKYGAQYAEEVQRIVTDVWERAENEYQSKNQKAA